jgi:hypothetical protein
VVIYFVMPIAFLPIHLFSILLKMLLDILNLKDILEFKFTFEIYSTQDSQVHICDKKTMAFKNVVAWAWNIPLNNSKCSYLSHSYNGQCSNTVFCKRFVHRIKFSSIWSELKTNIVSFRMIMIELKTVSYIEIDHSTLSYQRWTLYLISKRAFSLLMGSQNTTIFSKCFFNIELFFEMCRMRRFIE